MGTNLHPVLKIISANLQLLLDDRRIRDNLLHMNALSTTARTFAHATIATVSGLFIAAAVVFGAMALAVAGLMIGLAGALTSRLRAQERAAPVTLTARRNGRGWIVDPSDR
jgi:hypothetical protein